MTIEKSNESFKVNLPLLNLEQPQPVKETVMDLKVEDLKLVKAKERVRNIKEFYDELLKAVLILSFLAVLNWFTSDFPWVIFPAIGMSIGLFFQYMKNFDRDVFLGRDWQKNKIDELMNDQNF
jgi:hypothetical protein